MTTFLHRLKRHRKIVASSFASLALGMFTVLPAAASAASVSGLKAQSAAPENAQTTLTAPSATKPQITNTLLSPALAYTASLSASSTSLWPTQYTTLTATTNQDVGPTPYYLSILDVTANSYVKICGFGMSCAVSVTQATATTHTYRAYVSTYPSSVPPANIQATSANVNVTWKSLSVSLTASPTTVALHGNSTLTATTSTDVGPTPFYTEIFDTTTGARLNVCGFGTTCTAVTSQAVATTHRFVAYVAQYSAPVTGVQATSVANFVTWTAGNYRVSLTTTGTTTGHALVTATSNTNVGPTPYYIEIFNLNTGALIAVCGSGTTCSTNVTLAFGQNNYVAFVSSYSSTLPPLNTQASSNVASRFYFPIIIP